MEKFARTVLRNSSYGLIAQILIRILSFCFSIFVVRQLGAEEFGQYSAVLAFGYVFSFISDLGLSPYAVREIARYRDQPDGLEKARALYSNVLYLRFFLSLLTILLLLGAAWLTGRPTLIIIAIGVNSLGLILYAVQGASEAVLTGYERIDIASIARVAYQFVFVLVGAFVLFKGFGYFGLIIANLLGIFLMTIICWNGVRKLKLGSIFPRRTDWLRLLYSSLPFGIITFALGLSYKFDSVLLTIFRGDLETGFYNSAYNLVFSAVVFSNVINVSLYPSLTRQASLNPENLPRIFERTLRYLMVIALPIVFGVWALASQLVTFLYKSDYLSTVPALQIVIWVVPWMYASEFLGYIVVIANRESIVARSVLISTFFNIVLNLIFIPKFGYIAASIMTVATEVILVGQYVWTLRDQLKKIDLRNGLFFPFIASMIMGVVLLVIRDHMNLFLCIMIGTLAYFVMLFLFGTLGKEDYQFLKAIRAEESPVSKGSSVSNS